MRVAALLGLLIIGFGSLPTTAPPEELDGTEQGCCRGGNLAKPTTGVAAVSGARPAVSSWVVGVPGGGVRPPASTTRSQCTRWRPATDVSPDADPSDTGLFRVDPDGTTAVLYFRDCGEPAIRQFIWIRQEPPQEIARQALFDIADRLLAAPLVTLSPSTRAVVNLETWLSATDTGPISATAAIPGLSVTATATIASTAWDLGNGDTVTCPGTGVAWTVGDGDRRAPCGYTYRVATPAEVPHQVSAAFTWQITWRASTGATGTLPDIVSGTQTIAYPVNEIQTIGVRG